MPKKIRDKRDRSAEFLEKLLVLQLYTLGASQDRIAKTVGRQKAWVNEMVKGLPKGGRSGGGQAQAKKAKRRPGSR